MIICRTPFRVSFFGGGTDYPVWYQENGGAVLSTTIDKYCYISCRYLPPFFPYKHHIVYSKHERVNDINEIKHPAVREIFKYLNVSKGLSIHYDADLPARSGLGSSSSFIVGLLNSIYALKHKPISTERLAYKAIHLERGLLKENVGSQDQIAAAYGSFNRIKFFGDDTFDVTPILIEKIKLEELQNYLMFFFTGFSRYASDIAKTQIKETHKKEKELYKMQEMVDEAISILSRKKTSIDEFGKLLHESWKLKRNLTDKISNKSIDDMYETARNAGALGGKITGAGGGGFMLIIARPENHHRIREALNKLLYVPIRFETSGSKIIFHSSDGH